MHVTRYLQHCCPSLSHQHRQILHRKNWHPPHTRSVFSHWTNEAFFMRKSQTQFGKRAFSSPTIWNKLASGVLILPGLFAELDIKTNRPNWFFETWTVGLIDVDWALTMTFVIMITTKRYIDYIDPSLLSRRTLQQMGQCCAATTRSKTLTGAPVSH